MIVNLNDDQAKNDWNNSPQQKNDGDEDDDPFDLIEKHKKVKEILHTADQDPDGFYSKCDYVGVDYIDPIVSAKLYAIDKENVVILHFNEMINQSKLFK